MKIRINKIFLMMMVSLFGMINSVYALENNNIVDFSRRGSISITLKDKDNSKYIEGAEISLYHVANATEKNHNLSFVYTEQFKDCQVTLTDLEDETLASSISNCITEDSSSMKEITNNEGKVKFSNLDLGIYLVMQTNEVLGYSSIDEFLVMIPKIEENSWIYEIESTPKTEIYQVVDIIVEKVWNTTVGNITDSIEVGLYKGEELIDKVKLSEENNWMYTWERIEKSDEYSVKEINVPAGFTDTYRQVDNKFIITNTKTLVQTGLRLWIVELLLFSGLTLIVIGIICEKRNKYE